MVIDPLDGPPTQGRLGRYAGTTTRPRVTSGALRALSAIFVYNSFEKG